MNLPKSISFLIVSAFIMSFFVWKYRKDLKIKKENVFDFIILFSIVPLITGRLVYVFENTRLFVQKTWSIYPYYYEPGAERIWFKEMPWILFKFWDNGDINYSALLLGMFFSVVLFILIKNIRKVQGLLLPLIISQIIVLSGLYWGVYYWGKETELFFGIRYPGVDDSFRMPLQFIQILILIVLGGLIYIFRDRKGGGIFWKIYIIVFSWLEIFVLSFKDNVDANSTEVMIYVYLTLSIISLVSIILNIQEKERKFMDKIPPSYYKNVKSRERDYSVGYRSFQTSFKNYKKATPLFFQKFKRSLFQFFRKSKSEDKMDS